MRHRKGDQGLARPTFPSETEDLAPVNSQGYTVHGAEIALGPRKLNPEALNGKQGGSAMIALLCDGEFLKYPLMS